MYVGIHLILFCFSLFFWFVFVSVFVFVFVFSIHQQLIEMSIQVRNRNSYLRSILLKLFITLCVCFRIWELQLLHIASLDFAWHLLLGLPTDLNIYSLICDIHLLATWRPCARTPTPCRCPNPGTNYDAKVHPYRCQYRCYCCCCCSAGCQ